MTLAEQLRGVAIDIREESCYSGWLKIAERIETIASKVQRLEGAERRDADMERLHWQIVQEIDPLGQEGL